MNFKDCPMYGKSHENKKDLDVLHKGHRSIVKELKKMGKINHKKDKFMMKHMDREEIQHEVVAEKMEISANATLEMGKIIATLLKDKTDRDKAKDKRERIKEGLFVALSILVIVGAYNFFMDMMVMRKVLTGE